jgi:polar amino acid transport system substrate-binding protein
MAASKPVSAALWLEAGLPFGGLMQIDTMFMGLLAQRLGVTFDLQVLPWRRCLLDAQQGRVDGVMAISHSAERAVWLAYPMRQGLPDASLRVRLDRYHWYARSEQTLSWDGRSLEGLGSGSVGAVAGYSVVGVLRDMGFKVDEQAGSTQATLRMLSLARIEAAAVLATEAEPLLQADPQLAKTLKRLEPALLERAYFLGFSKPFAAEQLALVQRIWAELPVVRELPLLRRAELAPMR